jgi:ferredoxin
MIELQFSGQPNPIFYFSGTGGCLAAAKKLCEEMPEFSPVPIAALEGESSVSVDAGAVGLVFPLFYAGLPNIVDRFMKKLAFARPCYVFAVVACGFPWSGYALHKLKWMLGRKKQKLSAGFYLPMVDNFLPHFDMPTPEDQEAVYASVDAKLAAIIECLKNRGRKVEHEKALLLYPSHAVYMPKLKQNDRFFKADETCSSCGICQKVCPVGNIELKGGKPEWLHRCEFCLACIQYCPQKAIQWKDITQKKGRYHYKGIAAGEIAKQKSL